MTPAPRTAARSTGFATLVASSPSFRRASCGRDGQLGESVSLHLEGVIDLHSVRIRHEPQGTEWCRIPAFGLSRHLTLGQRKEQRAARARVLKDASLQRLLPSLASSFTAQDVLEERRDLHLVTRLGCQAVEQPDAASLGGRDCPSGQDHVERRLDAHERRQADAPAESREDSELHLRQADACGRVVRGDPIVAGQDELGAAAQTRPIDRREGRHRKALDPSVGGDPRLDLADQSIEKRHRRCCQEVYFRAGLVDGDPADVIPVYVQRQWISVFKHLRVTAALRLQMTKPDPHARADRAPLPVEVLTAGSARRRWP
jgi:hypothetical protein